MFYAFNRIVTSRITLCAIILLILGLLVWFAGPLVRIDSRTPLETPASRIYAILAVTLLMLLFEALRRWRLHHLNRRVLSELGEVSRIGSVHSGSEAIREGFEDLMRVLRLGGQKRGRRLGWYLMLGEAGVGRTTALEMSGLEFPLEHSIAGGAIGNASCQWRVTDHAVYIDAPSSLISAAPGSGLDGTEWGELVSCLRGRRRRRPLDGVILTISADRLIDSMRSFGENRIGRFAVPPDMVETSDSIRRRLQSLTSAFGVVVPVYVLVTKCDLVPGFSEFFADFGVDELESPFGVSRASSAPAARSRGQAPNGPALDGLLADLSMLVEVLLVRRSRRLAAERDADVRKRVFGFPYRFFALHLPLEQMLRRIFAPSRFYRDVLLRGVWFCSAGPEAAGGYQRPLAQGISIPQLPVRDPAPVRAPHFVAGFLREALGSDLGRAFFPVQGARRRRLAWAAVSVFSFAGIAFCGLWWLASDRISGRMQSVSIALDRHEDSARAKPEGFVSAAQAVVPLRAAAELARRDPAPSGFDLDMAAEQAGRYMLPGPSRLADSLDGAYREAAHALVQPAVFRDISNEMDELAAAGRTDELRSRFELYLGLHDSARFEPQSLTDWAAPHVHGRFPLDTETRNEVFAVLSDIFARIEPATSPDPKVVADIRAALLAEPPAQQIYGRLIDAGEGMVADMTLEQALGWPHAALFVPATEVDGFSGVPGRFTEAAYYEEYLLDLPGQIKAWRDQDWVHGHSDQKEDTELFAEVSRLYSADYAAAWSRFLSEVRLRPADDWETAVAVLETLLAADSPLERLAGTVRHNTVLPIVRGSEDGAPQEGQLADGIADAVLAASAPPEEDWPGARIGSEFSAWRDLDDATTGSLPGFESIRDALKGLHGEMISVSADSEVAFGKLRSWMDMPESSGISALRRVAASQPEALKRMLNKLADELLGLVIADARQHVAAVWRERLYSECVRVIEGRYPADRHASVPIPPEDFEAFFGSEGSLAGFYGTYVAPFVQSVGSGRRERSVLGRTVGFSEDALDAFQNGRAVSRAYGLDDGRLADLEFSLKPHYLSNDARRVAVRTPDASMTYRHEPPRGYRFAFASDQVEIAIADRNGVEFKSGIEEPWAWLRMLDRHELRLGTYPDRFRVSIRLGGMAASFEIAADSTANPLSSEALNTFRCEPGILQAFMEEN